MTGQVPAADAPDPFDLPTPPRGARVTYAIIAVRKYWFLALRVLIAGWVRAATTWFAAWTRCVFFGSA